MGASYSDDRDEESLGIRASLPVGRPLRTAQTVAQPRLMTSEIFQNPVHLRPKTLAIVQEAYAEQPDSLVFCLDASSVGTMTIYRGASVSVDGRGHWAVESAVWASPAVPFNIGLAQRRSVEWVALPEAEGLESVSSSGCVADAPPGPCGLLVELQSVGAAAERTWCRLGRGGLPGVAAIVEAVRQQVCLDAEGPALETLEVYCSDLSADGLARQDCVVCQSEPRDTVVLPCRHLCLCVECSERVRTRVQQHSYRCPLCRERIASMMRIDRPAEVVESA